MIFKRNVLFILWEKRSGQNRLLRLRNVAELEQQITISAVIAANSIEVKRARRAICLSLVSLDCENISKLKWWMILGLASRKRKFWKVILRFPANDPKNYEAICLAFIFQEPCTNYVHGQYFTLLLEHEV